MDWIYLSPHFDDVALSCGGLIWEQVQAGQSASIWTICAGGPPSGPLSVFAQSLHDRWQTGEQAVSRRQAEDIAACQALGAGWRHFDLPDCIYRPGGKSGVHYYDSEQALWGDIHPDETPLVEKLAEIIGQEISPAAQVICPLTLGRHVDHRLTRAVAEHLGRRLWYYLDYPYVLKETTALDELQQTGWQSITFAISEGGLAAWQDAIAAYQSQISTFWPNLEAMCRAIQEYKEQMGGVRLEEFVTPNNAGIAG
jgi:LmbE family N-acetylglucosaminyl deacetylase